MMVFACLIGLVLGAAAPSGQIAYLSGTGQEDQCLCVIDVASGAISKPDATAVAVGRPAWSPDGSRVAVPTREPDGVSIRIVSAAGGEPIQVNCARKWNCNPRWSPNGALLAYEAGDGEGFDHRQIAVYDVASGTESVWGGGRPGLMYPVWLPNLRIFDLLPPAKEMPWQDAQGKVVGTYEPRGDVPIFLAAGFEGGKGRPTLALFLGAQEAVAPLLTGDNYVEWLAEPSPNGRCIAFESNDGGDREIFVASKSSLSDVTNHRAADWNPVWAPDSEWLAFESFRDGRRGIYRVHANTGRVLPVAAPPSREESTARPEPDSKAKGCDPMCCQDWSPSWSPDGKWIAFVSDRTGNSEIFITDPEGRTVKQLTESSGANLAPAWRPEARR